MINTMSSGQAKDQIMEEEQLEGDLDELQRHVLEHRNELMAPVARPQRRPLLPVNPPQVPMVARQQQNDLDMTDTVLQEDLEAALETAVLSETPRAAMEDSVPSEKSQAAVDVPKIEVRENEVFVDNFMPTQWSQAAMDFIPSQKVIGDFFQSQQAIENFSPPPPQRVVDDFNISQKTFSSLVSEAEDEVDMLLMGKTIPLPAMEEQSIFTEA